MSEAVKPATPEAEVFRVGAVRSGGASQTAGIVSLEDRRRNFDPDGTLHADLLEAWSIVQNVLDRQLEVASNQMLADPVLGRAMGGRRTLELVAEGRRRTKAKFCNPIDQAWVDDLGSAGVTCVKLGVSASAMLAVIHAGSVVFLNYAIDQLAGDTARLKRVVNAITTVEAVEIELVVATMSALLGQAAQRRLNQHGVAFESQVTATVDQITRASAQLRVQAAKTAGDSADMLKRSTEVAAATAQSTVALREAARLAITLSRVIEGTHTGIGRAADTAAQASAQSAATMETVAALMRDSQDIESVVSLIKSVAGQTNMLALNATIEAARAGDAGRGFAVVAQEVKSLAAQVGKATDDIARQINIVRAASARVVSATKSVGDTVTGIHSSAGEMRTHIGSQVEAVMAISAALEESSRSAEEVAGNIGVVRSASERIAHDMTDINQATQSVDTMLVQLQTDMDSFRQALVIAA